MTEFDFVSIISTVGFPIFAFLLIYLDLRKLINKNTEALDKLTDMIISSRR